MHGVVAKRTARYFGVDYEYERRAAVQEAEPIPEWLAALPAWRADRLAPRRAGVRGASLLDHVPGAARVGEARRL